MPYYDPSFEAMIRLQCKFAEEGYEKLGGVQRYFPDNVRDDYAAGQLDSQVSDTTSGVKCATSGSMFPFAGRKRFAGDEGSVYLQCQWLRS